MISIDLAAADFRTHRFGPTLDPLNVTGSDLWSVMHKWYSEGPRCPGLRMPISAKKNSLLEMHFFVRWAHEKRPDSIRAQLWSDLDVWGLPKLETLQILRASCIYKFLCSIIRVLLMLIFFFLKKSLVPQQLEFRLLKGFAWLWRRGSLPRLWNRAVLRKL